MPDPCFTASHTEVFDAVFNATVQVDWTPDLLPIAAGSVPVSVAVSIGGIATTAPAWPIYPGLASIQFTGEAIQFDPDVVIGLQPRAVWFTADSGGAVQLDNLIIVQGDHPSGTTFHTTVTKGIAGAWTSSAVYYGVAAAQSFFLGSPSIDTIISATADVFCAVPTFVRTQQTVVFHGTSFVTEAERRGRSFGVVVA